MFHRSHHSEIQTLRRWVLVLLAGLVTVVVLPAPDVARGLAGYAPLHTLLEVFSVAVAAMIFGTSWATQRYRVDGRALVLGVSFLGVALLDVSHALSYEGMPAFVTASGPEKAINFWLAARTMAGLSMLWAAYWPRRLDAQLNQLPPRSALAAMLVLVVLVNGVVLYHPDVLPRTFVPGEGLTAFKLGYEYALIAAYVVAGIGYLCQMRRTRVFGSALLAAAAFTMAMGEFFFTLYANVTDVYNLVGHLYKVLAYGLLYQALFVDSVQRPFQAVQQLQARQQATLDMLPDLLFEIDASGVCVAVHANDVGNLGTSANTLVGKNIRDVWPSEVVNASLDAMAEAQQQSVSGSRQIQLNAPEGVRHFELSVSKAKTEGNDEARFLVLSRDVTQSVQLARNLKFEADVNAALLDLRERSGTHDERDLLCHGAAHAQGLTQSSVGFVHLVHEGEQGSDLMAWNCRDLQIGSCAPNAGVAPPPSMLDHTRPWFKALQAREPVVLTGNEAPVQSTPSTLDEVLNLGPLVSVPALDGGQVRLLLVVASREGAYPEPMVQALRLLATELWALVKRQRQDAVIHRLSEALEQSPYPVVITNAEARIQYANRAFTEVSGYLLDEVKGCNPRLLQSGRTPKATYVEMWGRLTQAQPWQGEFINRRKDGRFYTERALVYPIHDALGRVSHYVAHKEDVTQRKAAEERIQQLSAFDALTGLFNKKALEEQLSAALTRAEAGGSQVALLWCNLDNFKAINDSLGRTTGDEMLLECSKRLRQVFGQQMALGRYAGDTFVAIVPEAQQAAVALLAQKALHHLSQPTESNGNLLSLSASVGIATYPGDATDASGLATAAESAMYRVKDEGRNSFRFFAPDMQAHTQRSLALAADLRQAVEKNELRLVYQPQLDLRSRRIVGGEALLRWHHPTWGTVSPAEFIPLAEQTGAIVDMGLWVADQVARQLRAWHDAGVNIDFVAINVSAIQFAQPDLYDRLLAIVRQHGLLPQHIEVELTEAVALRDPLGAGAKIQRLHDAGFRVSIDDFGTGYSSMSYLKRYALDKLKIDQSFVRDLADDSGDQAIVTAIIKMAHSLGLTAIAEGVETSDQADFLLAAGCEEIQGYWFSRPLDARAFEDFVRAHAQTAAV